MCWDIQYERLFAPFDNPDYKPGKLQQCDGCPAMTREIFQYKGYKFCIDCFMQAVGEKPTKKGD